MALTQIKEIVAGLCPPCDSFLVETLVDEFRSIERRYVQSDWGPAELDAGRLSEAASRILYHQDSGNLSLKKGVAPCLSYIENDSVSHNVQPRHNALHLGAAIRMAYKFRSQRGAVHLSPDYTANEMDSKFMLETSRWIINEIFRLFWQKDKSQIASIVRQLLRFDIPIIRDFGELLLIQRTDLSAEEEILLLLHHAGEEGMSRKELGRHTMYSPSSVTNSLKKLCAKDQKQTLALSGARYVLTDLGERRIRETLSAKLTSN